MIFFNFLRKNKLLLILILVICFFVSPFLLKGLLPIPSDTIIGLYHPFRDSYAKNYPNGIPFKNFLITDPVRQIYPWKELVVDNLFKLSLPLWNPYEMAGKPLLANFQSGVFYPLNVIFILKPFYVSWSIFVISQMFLSGIFLYLYLKNLKLSSISCLVGAICYTFSGFSIAWLEWGTILHTVLWLPLVLLSIDKVFSYSYKNIKNTKLFLWSSLLTFSLVASFFAGHLQTFFYLFIFSSVYFFARWFQNGRKKNIFVFYCCLNIVFLILTAIQWIPTLQFVQLSARAVDQAEWTKEGWFVPWQNLIQFFAPDFFGNPATLNYWGVWNYAEFIGYIGIVPLFFALFSLFARRDKKTFFFTTAALSAFIFALPTPFAKIIYLLNIPFFSTSQPTRLIFIVSFSLSILAALGFDYFIKNKNSFRKEFLLSAGVFGLIFVLLWIIVFLNNLFFNLTAENLLTAKRNLLFPTLIFVGAGITLLCYLISKKKLLQTIFLILLSILLSFDQVRFAQKFEPFTKKEYLFPDTKILEFLKKDTEIFRIVSTDSRILPPNFATHYRIQSIEGYDPLYLMSYAELIASSERKSENIFPPFGFNRIITPHNIESPIIDLLNVKYVLSLNEIKLPKLTKVFQEGQTNIYLNNNYLSRAFFVKEVIVAKTKYEQIHKMFISQMRSTAIVDRDVAGKKDFSVGEVDILVYTENKVVLKTNNFGDGFLVFTDAYYPTWKVLVDSKRSEIYKTDYAFRGVYVPKGEHYITFYNTIF